MNLCQFYFVEFIKLDGVMENSVDPLQFPKTEMILKMIPICSTLDVVIFANFEKRFQFQFHIFSVKIKIKICKICTVFQILNVQWSIKN